MEIFRNINWSNLKTFLLFRERFFLNYDIQYFVLNQCISLYFNIFQRISIYFNVFPYISIYYKLLNHCSYPSSIPYFQIKKLNLPKIFRIWLSQWQVMEKPNVSFLKKNHHRGKSVEQQTTWPEHKDPWHLPWKGDRNQAWNFRPDDQGQSRFQPLLRIVGSRIEHRNQQFCH